MNLGAGLLRRGKQHVVQGGTGQTEKCGIVGTGQLHAGGFVHHVAVGVAKAEALVGKPGGHTIVCDAETDHRPDQVALRDDAHVVDAPLRFDLGDLNVDSGSAQPDGQGQTADPAAYDEHIADVRHSLLPKPHTLEVAPALIPSRRAAFPPRICSRSCSVKPGTAARNLWGSYAPMSKG